MNIVTTLDAIAAALSRGEEADALTILGNARDVLANAPEEVSASLTQRLNVELDAAHLAMERLGSVLTIVVEALYRRGVDDDHGFAVCLENAFEAELAPAMDRIQDALTLTKEVANG